MILIEGHTIETNLSFCSRLTVQSHIASGRYGDVYKVVDPASSRCYALKHIRFGKNKKKTADIDEIIAETIKSTSRIGNEIFLHLNSPYVVKNYGLVRLEALEFALLFEYIEGEDLDEWLSSRPGIPWCQKEDLFLKILEGVKAIHQKNIIHHDLKPQNILIDKKGNPRIFDFGLSTYIDKDFSSTREYRGTPTYIAPENFIGLKTSGQFDIYSLGCILYQMYRGRNYLDICGFERPPLDRMLGRDGLAVNNILDLDTKFPNISREDKRLANVIRRATGFNPVYRYPDISSFIKDLRPGYKSNPSASSVPKTPPPPKLKIIKVLDTRFKRFKILFFISLPLLLASLGMLTSVLISNDSLENRVGNLKSFVNKYNSQLKQNSFLKTKIKGLGKTIKHKNNLIKTSFFKVGKQPFSNPSSFAAEWKHFFYVHRPLRIHSIIVYPKEEGEISINLYNIKDEIISQSSQISLKPKQWQRIQLGFNIKPGRYYFTFSGTCNLAYSNDNIFYPYQIENLISITGAHSDSNYYDQRYYLYFYEWIVSPVIE